MFEPIEFPTSLPTWPSPSLEFAKPDAPQSRSRKAARLGAVAIAVGLVLGGLAWAYWRSKQQHESASAAPPSPAASVPTPAPERVSLPRTQSETDHLLQTARAWLSMTPDVDDFELARAVWAFHWRDVPFPTTSRIVARPALADALDLVLQVIAAVRAEQPEAAANNMPATAADPVEPTDAAAPVRETPTPGCFYRVRQDDDLLGAAGVAARALCEAAIDAGRRKDWPVTRAESHAKRLSSKAQAQSAYTDLIRRGEWNTRHSSGLSEGALLWLPPLRELGLLDRSRSRRVSLDPRPWPDGTTRLEPPPMLRELRTGQNEAMGVRLVA